jgi:hypothetical protein
MRLPKKESAGTTLGGSPESIQQTIHSVPKVAAAGKSLAVRLYCIEATSLSATQAAFARHPEWVSA